MDKIFKNRPNRLRYWTNSFDTKPPSSSFPLLAPAILSSYHAYKKKTVVLECFVNDEEAPHEWHKDKTAIDLVRKRRMSIAFEFLLDIDVYE